MRTGFPVLTSAVAYLQAQVGCMRALTELFSRNLGKSDDNRFGDLLDYTQTAH